MLTVIMSMTEVFTRTMRPITVRPGAEPDWSPFMAENCVFFRYEDQMLPYFTGDSGAVLLRTLADAFGLRPDSIRINGRRYNPSQNPSFITLTNPDEYSQKLYQDPKQPAVVTGEPVFNLLRYVKGAISSLFLTASDDAPGSTAKQAPKKHKWVRERADTSNKKPPVVAKCRRAPISCFVSCSCAVTF